MRIYVTTTEPTKAQLDAIRTEAFPATILGGREGDYHVGWDDETYDLPGWLEGCEEIIIALLQ